MTPKLNPPPLPPGFEKHHIVVLESIHCRIPTFDFPHTIKYHERTNSKEVSTRIKDATIVIACVTPVTAEDLISAPNLGCLSIMAVGIGWVNKPFYAGKKITVTNCIAGNVDAVGEQFLGLYFSTRRKIVEAHSVVTSTNDWIEKGTLTKIWKKGVPMGCGQETLGIIGYGNLGKRIEKLAKSVGFGNILISERKSENKIRNGRTSFDEVIKSSTTIVVCVPKEDNTIDLISEKEFDVMKDECILINLARGGIVNEFHLTNSLKSGKISGAATDVLEIEPGGLGSTPLIPESNQERIPNLVISPHIAWYTQSTIKNYQRLLKEGIEGWVRGDLFIEEEKVRDVVVVHDGKVWR